MADLSSAHLPPRAGVGLTPEHCRAVLDSDVERNLDAKREEEH